MNSRGRPRVVIVGAGFGGLSAAQALAASDVEITVVDRRNHHLFQPLLYQVATAGLSPSQIASPVRTVLRREANARVILAEVTGVDRAGKRVLMGETDLPYDFLVLATGATHAYFGHDDWAAVAPGLKTLDDAVAIRRRVLSAFERAEISRDAHEQERLLTFVVVGGGATGVELAGAVAELAKRALKQDFRAISGAVARAVLVEAGSRVLPTFDPRLSAYALRALKRLGVDVRLGAAVEDCDERGVRIGDQRLDAGAVIWAAGVKASPVAAWLGVEGDRAGRVVVGPDLSLPEDSSVFVIGDAALAIQPDGKPAPGIAPAAKQEGVYVAKLIAAAAKGGPSPRPFRYRSYGNLATIGRHAAVVEIGPVRLTGLVAWLFWSLAHIYFLIGFRNRVLVSLEWLWAYLTFERGARLITGEAADLRATPPEAPGPASPHRSGAA
ncbi:MAG: FAD-dependent pyridine nucleotide-disulfide oxidoreductase [Caulobacteraceae bacterium]|nr:FAD-dependent pyridine nucleotide-disulfide oxidoreductase [Caulobacteraceae bacterium]